MKPMLSVSLDLLVLQFRNYAKSAKNYTLHLDPNRELILLECGKALGIFQIIIGAFPRDAWEHLRLEWQEVRALAYSEPK
jgi:hypothetical protein